jgi:hypothetical protein
MVVFEKKNGESGMDKQVLWESSEILQTFLPSLYPSEIATQVKEMESDIGKRLGPSIRCIAYYSLLSDLKKYQNAIVAIAADPMKMSSIESTLWGKFLPHGLADGISKALNLNQTTNDASYREIRDIFRELSDKLDNEDVAFLMDKKNISYGFTAADLTLAALAYPIIRPPEMESWLASMDDLPPEINNLTIELRETRAGQHVLKIYKEYRPINEAGLAVMKHVDRNRSFYDWLFGS